MKSLVVPYVTFGQVQQKAMAAGLVMSRRPDGITIRHREVLDASSGWSRLTVSQALDIIEQVSSEGGASDVGGAGDADRDGRPLSAAALS